MENYKIYLFYLLLNTILVTTAPVLVLCWFLEQTRWNCVLGMLSVILPK